MVNDPKESYQGSRGGSYITKWLSGQKCVLNWPKTRPAKMPPKIACSALPGDPIAVRSVTNNSIFIKWTWVKFLGLETGYQDHKMAPQPRKRPNLTKHCQKSTKQFLFCSDRGANSCYISSQSLYFKSGITWPKAKKCQNSRKTHFLLWWGTRQLLHTSVINHSIIFIKWPCVRFSGFKRGLSDHTMAPRSQKRPYFCPKKSKTTQKITFCFGMEIWQLLHR